LAPTRRGAGHKTFELTQFLVDVVGVEDHGGRFDGRISLHDSCQALRALGISTQPRRLIAKVAGAEFVEMRDSERCCGFGGSFSVKYPEISTAMVDDRCTTSSPREPSWAWTSAA
jgi:L-lactate dehydrogenase complex protein LldE